MNMNLFEIPPDRYDAARRAWIARHGNVFNFQKRRAQLLARQIRERIRAEAGARPEEQDDFVIDPIWYRKPTTLDAFAETAIIITLVVLAPMGWLLGRLLYRWIVKQIPDNLSAYPITALTWAGTPIGLMFCLSYDPRDSITVALGGAWVLAQIPATFLAAALYGILNGWLAVDGSADWWPLTRETLRANRSEDLDKLERISLTGAQGFERGEPPAKPRKAPTPKTRTKAGRHVDTPWMVGLGVAVAASLLYCYLVVTGTLNVIGQEFSRLGTIPSTSYYDTY
ncbi:Uncharacterised protein [Mycobacteroides abscessus subsp. massiliense]|nr:Uncharacterised protein [Mycobacteroides abscessus subsp. massiliense]SKN39347.1 Uncharacterised protein [Mycobacteroides abscessus subsp. abscessus]SKF45739.1 Uncharacterised protein [Mycobacteroides abscessus subsp. massiliense]SKF47597.1 Uncharacterised protein [Mycobacteroides abscessus subsp. massiliense]SKF47658.1 Uncharacterised protein [Mycobacteroides abscessus subsp. massiliense]